MNNIIVPESALLFVKQYKELKDLEKSLSPILQVSSSEETATHMAVRLATEREIQGRMDYLAYLIADAVAGQIKDK